MCICEINGIFTAFDIPDAPWRDDLGFWAQCFDSKFKTHLVVAFSGRTMSNVIRAFLLGNFNKSLSDQWTCAGSTKQVPAFIYCTRADDWIYVITHKLFLKICNINFACTRSERFIVNNIKLIALTNITANSDNFTIVIVFF